MSASQALDIIGQTYGRQSGTYLAACRYLAWGQAARVIRTASTIKGV